MFKLRCVCYTMQMIEPPLSQPAVKVIEGGREALEREALEALILDEPRYHVLKRQLFEQPPPAMRLIESCVTSPLTEQEVPLP